MGGIADCVHCFSMAFYAAAVFCCSAAQAQILIHFDLPVQPLAQSLKAIGTAANTDIGFNADRVAGLIAPPLKADLAVDGALKRVLVGTGLRPQHLDDHTIVIAATGSSATDSSEIRLMLVKASAPAKAGDQIATPQVDATADSTDSSSRSNATKKELEEIVVTGTHIHGAEPTSRVSTYTRTYIETQGFGSLTDFIQSLPENFNGGASTTTIGSVVGPSNSFNGVNGSGVDLRGLGSDATLVLLNGHRIAPGNTQGNFVDISMIPLSAIERVEILPDGASAIYGSDAVGGVVNILLRDNLEGGETSVRFGSVTQGGRKEYQASQAIGHDWGSGSAVLAYDFDKTTALLASDRYYTANTTTEPSDLLPRGRRNSILLTLQQNVQPGVQLFADGTFSHRTGQSDLTSYPSASQRSHQNIDAYSGAVGLLADVSSSIKFELTSNYSSSHTNSRTYDLYAAGALTGDVTPDTNIFSVDGKFDGTLATLPTGPMLFAIGGQYRREVFSYLSSNYVSENFANSRNVGAVFAELHIPLIGPAGSAARASVLELVLADRYERYSDFGNTNNPNVGLLWRVSPSLKFRANYSTSFVAPLLTDLNPIPSGVFALPGAFFGPGAPNTILLYGGNPNLQPQKSKNWTLGGDYNPQDLPRLKAYANYYHIAYTDRINDTQALLGNILNAFQNEGTLGPTIVRRNPSAAYLQALESASTFMNYGVANLATISAVIDNRWLNLSSVTTSGIDFGATFGFSSVLGESELGLDGTCILKFDNQFTNGSPVASFLNHPYNPIDLRLRARGSVQRGPTSVTIFLNYVNSYRNYFNNQVIPAASWTTVDLTGKYDFTRSSGPLNRLSALIGVTNLMNRAPPFVANTSSPVYNINYDGANANPLGRFLSLQIIKKF